MEGTTFQNYLNDIKCWMSFEPKLAHGKLKFFIIMLTVKIWIIFGIWFLKFKMKLI